MRILKNHGLRKPPLSRFSVQWRGGLSLLAIVATLMPQRCREKFDRRLTWAVWLAAASLLAIRSTEAADLSLEMQQGVPCLLSNDWARYRLSEPSVKAPAGVRYAWQTNPVVSNLYNMECLPAGFFSTLPPAQNRKNLTQDSTMKMNYCSMKWKPQPLLALLAGCLALHLRFPCN